MRKYTTVSYDLRSPQARMVCTLPAAPTPPAPPVIPAPVITSGTYFWDRTAPGFADVQLTMSFDQGALPVAYLQVWVSVEFGPEFLVATVPSTGTLFDNNEAAESEIRLDYRMRYADGALGPTFGPFSEPFTVEVSLP